MKELRAVFFDLDDTLADTEGLTALRLASVRGMLVEMAPADRVDLVLADAPTWDPTGKQHRLQRLSDALSLTEEQFTRVRAAYNRVMLDNLRLHRGARRLLDWLRRRVGVGLITNGPSEMQRAKLASLGISPCFDTIVVSGEVQVHKPDPRIFELALENLTAKPSEALYVGDRPNVDIAGARAAGLTTVLVRTSYPFPLPPGPDPDFSIECVADLQDLVLAQGWVLSAPNGGGRAGAEPAERASHD